RPPSDVFFFSSRRRHTRFSRDWSSDVCSSDLKFLTAAHHDSYFLQMSTIHSLKVDSALEIGPGENAAGKYLKTLGLKYDTLDIRSEERRVGKECRRGCPSSPARKTNTVSGGGV